MKWFTSLVILLFCYGFTQAQSDTAKIIYTPMAAAGYQFKYFIADSGLNAPFKGPTLNRGTIRPGAIICNTADSLLYYYNGISFVPIGVTGGGGFRNDTVHTIFPLKADSTTFPGSTAIFIEPTVFDSLRHKFIDTGSSIRNGYLLGYDSTNQKWALYAPGGGGGGISQGQLDDSTSAIRADFPTGGSGVTSIAAGYGLTGGTITTTGTIKVDTSLLLTQLKAASIYLQNITGLVTPGANVTVTGSGTNGSPYVINSSGSGTSGISKLGSPAYGLTKTNDSTYIVDTSVIASQIRLHNDSSALAAAIGAGSLPTIANLRYAGNVTGSTASIAASSLHYSVFNVLDFGLVNDSSTDNTTAFRSLLSTIPDGSAIYFPGGGAGTGYLFSDSVTINKSLKIYGDGSSSYTFWTLINTPLKGATNLYFTSATANFFCVHTSSTNKDPVITIHDMSLINTATTTAGSAITFNDEVGHSILYNFMIFKFYNGISIISANSISIRDFTIVGCLQDAIVWGNALVTDYGNNQILDGYIVSGTGVTSTARGIYLHGAGGVSIDNIHFNGQQPTTFNTHFIYDIYSDWGQAATSEMHLTNLHCDNYQTTALKLSDTLTGANFAHTVISNCHFAGSNTSYAIDVDHYANLIIGNIIAVTSGNTGPVIRLTSVFDATLGIVQYENYTSKDTIVTSPGSVRNALTGDKGGITGLSLSSDKVTGVNLSTGVSGGQSAVGGTASGENLTLASTTNGTKGHINSDNVKVIGTALGGSVSTDNFLNVTGTLPTVISTSVSGAYINITGAGSSFATPIALRADLEAGYTGSTSTEAITSNNFSLGAGNNISGVAALAANTGAVMGARGAATTGSNIGSYNWGSGGLRNVGSVNEATLSQVNSTSALSGGVVGFAKRANSSAIEFGGYFALQATQPIFVSAALIANTSAESSVPAQIWQINGTEKDRVDSLGAMLINTPNSNSTLTDNGSFAAGYVAKATSYTATISDYTIEVTATGQTITLPTAIGIQGREYIIKLTASGSATVGTTSSQTIDGSTTYTLSSQYKYVTVQSNNANWIVIANN